MPSEGITAAGNALQNAVTLTIGYANADKPRFAKAQIPIVKELLAEYATALSAKTTGTTPPAGTPVTTPPAEGTKRG